MGSTWITLVLTSALLHAAPTTPTYRIGVAKIDITPTYPVRLSGFGARRTESAGITQRIWAKALVIDDGTPAVLITVDNLGVPAYLVQELADRLARKAGIRRERLAVTATHTHTAPMLRGVAPTLFGTPIPKEHQEHIDRYTTEFTNQLEAVALAALADRKPAHLSWGIGTVGFAVNRRTKGGPVDHDLPLLVVRDDAGKVRALYLSYACHCVTLSDNQISGDWAGYAQQALEASFPGAVALVSIGCGADANPSSGVTGAHTEIAAQQGAEIATEVRRLLQGFLAPLTGKIRAARQRIALPLAPLPTRAAWAERGQRQDAVGYHARVQLARLERGEALRNQIDYDVQSWAFGDGLAMVFLPGEVVVDYSLRLKRELNGLRLWINAYANDAPCYIPSERVLKEGGYEGGGAMVYYDVPGPFQAGLEQRIVDAVHAQLDTTFKAPFAAERTAGSRPRSAQQSLATLRTKPELTVELMAAEPLVASPVAIDWGPDGRLWVAEMLDYPSGRAGDYQPGGRIRLLQDTQGTGHYDKATVFLENIPFPTGVRVWRKGILVCAAPDILYAEDTDGDGKADVVYKLFRGFGTENYQARVNSLEYGLDGWVYGSCGMFGGTIRTAALRAENGASPGKATGEVRLGNRDFRIQPDQGILEPATGRTQQGRVRDDWGNWFGCDNSNLCWHYPLPDHYLRRNPHVAPPRAAVLVPADPQPNRLYPIRAELQLFKLSGPPGQTTAACGLGIYRDDLLGAAYHGNALVCEPVNLLIHRLMLSPRGSTFAGHRAADEATSEFLASTDNWFRPMQARTGPDGCLWVVDMYRFVIEHPRWIPPEELAKLDVRAGSALGRIYRVRPRDQAPRPFVRLDKLDGNGLVAALDSPNGWQRDLAGQMLLWQPDPATVAPLQKLVSTSPRPETRLQALCLLGSRNEAKPALLQACLADPHPGVRRQALRLSEKLFDKDAAWGRALLPLVEDADAQVRLQLAFTLGAWPDHRAGQALAALALRHPDDVYLASAVLSSVQAGNLGDVLSAVFAKPAELDAAEPFVHQLLSVVAALNHADELAPLLRKVVPASGGKVARWQWAVLAGTLEALERRGQTIERLADANLTQHCRRMLAQARSTVIDGTLAEADRLAALQLLGHDPAERSAEIPVLARLVAPQNPVALQSAAISALGRIPEGDVAGVLVTVWKSCTPALQSQVLDLLLSREPWQRRLLQAIQANELPAAQVDAKHRQRLLTHREEGIRVEAGKLFAGAAQPDREKVLQDYQDVTKMPGERSRGKAVFAKSCAACHRLQEVGNEVGPDLAALANKSPEYLLSEILIPNRNVDTRYIEYLAVTKDGRLFTGILASETATSITLKGQQAKEQVLLRSELEELHSSGKSLMPEGLEKELTKQNLADLLRYLQDSGK